MQSFVQQRPQCEDHYALESQPIDFVRDKVEFEVVPGLVIAVLSQPRP